MNFDFRAFRISKDQILPSISLSLKQTNVERVLIYKGLFQIFALTILHSLSCLAFYRFVSIFYAMNRNIAHKTYTGCTTKSRDSERLNVLLLFFHSINFSGKKFTFLANWCRPARFAYNYLLVISEISMVNIPARPLPNKYKCAFTNSFLNTFRI